MTDKELHIQFMLAILTGSISNPNIEHTDNADSYIDVSSMLADKAIEKLRTKYDTNIFKQILDK